MKEKTLYEQDLEREYLQQETKMLEEEIKILENRKEAKIKKFLKIKVAQYFYLIVERPTRNRYGLPYTVAFYRTFKGLGANSGSIALCSRERRDIEFNMKKVMWNAGNLPGLEALVIHEVCHIVAPGKEGNHGPAFEKLYLKHAGDITPAIDTLVI